jgi:hypothetical protein
MFKSKKDVTQSTQRAAEITEFSLRSLRIFSALCVTSLSFLARDTERSKPVAPSLIQSHLLRA